MIELRRMLRRGAALSLVLGIGVVPLAATAQEVAPGDAPPEVDCFAPDANPALCADHRAASPPAAEDPAEEAPLPDLPAEATPAAEEFLHEGTAEAPASTAPATDAPAADAPTTEEPAAETPAAETPAAEGPAAEEPAPEVAAPVTAPAGAPATDLEAAPESSDAGEAVPIPESLSAKPLKKVE